MGPVAGAIDVHCRRQAAPAWISQKLVYIVTKHEALVEDEGLMLLLLMRRRL